MPGTIAFLQLPMLRRPSSKGEWTDPQISAIVIHVEYRSKLKEVKPKAIISVMQFVPSNPPSPTFHSESGNIQAQTK